MSATTLLGSLLEGYTPSIVLAVSAVFLILWNQLSVKWDPREPPIYKPRLPYIGHIIGLLRDQAVYFEKLSANRPMSIFTMPMINAKIYVITEPLLVQSAFRSKSLSFEPFMEDFAERMLGVSDENMKLIRSKPEDEKVPSFMRDFFDDVHTAMAPQHLHKMNAEALNNVAVTVNSLGDNLGLESLWIWLRTTLTVATSTALYGSHNPLLADPSLVDDLWTFEGGLRIILVNVFPQITAASAYNARERLQKALVKYYSAKHDFEPDVARMTKVRAANWRNHGSKEEHFGRDELALLHVATANAIPTLFWNMVFVASDPSVTEDIRKELVTIITDGARREDGKREVLIDIRTRRVMKDTTITDGTTSYLLTKGCDVMMPAGITHLATSTWGANASSFDARRFLKPELRGMKTEKEIEEDKAQKKAYFPFGGGRHLCPGRNFAMAEILGTISVLLLGFEVKSTDGGLIKVPGMITSKFGEAVGKPNLEGQKMGARIERRKGWENVVWKFVC